MMLLMVNKVAKMSLPKKPRLYAAQLKKDAEKAKRLLILSGYYVDCWFVTKLESVLRIETTVINPVIECSDRDTIDALINTLYTVRADTYNVLGSAQFWNGSWFGTQNIVAAHSGKPETRLVNGKPLPSKIFEWTVQDTAKNILASQEASKVEIIKRIYKRIPLHVGADLTKQQVALNKELTKQRQAAIDALKSFETIKTIPWLLTCFDTNLTARWQVPRFK
ncbi:hypothetical protein CAL7102_00253 [Dulcicalothrix desertica PCC 7102]|nr:hypothetical protein CAL7102_00253 [Dulcicalothrix desertica PCC 7102]